MDTFFIPTRASRIRQVTESQHAVTVHEDYKPKKRKIVSEDEQETTLHEEGQQNAPQFNIKYAKREVIKLGMTGFDAATQEEAKIKLAVKLGAKPPKNKYKNYKQLIEDKKKEKLKQQEEQNFQQLGKNKAGKSTAKGKSFDKKRKVKSDILNIYGTVKAKDLKNGKQSKQSHRKVLKK